MCPNCDADLACPCESCKDFQRGRPFWIWVNGEEIKCPVCGYQAHADAWENYEYEQYQKQSKAKRRKTMDKNKEEVVWAIFDGKILLPFLVQRTRKLAVKEFEKWMGESWGNRHENYSVKKCKIRLAEVSNG